MPEIKKDVCISVEDFGVQIVTTTRQREIFPTFNDAASDRTRRANVELLNATAQGLAGAVSIFAAGYVVFEESINALNALSSYGIEPDLLRTFTVSVIALTGLMAEGSAYNRLVRRGQLLRERFSILEKQEESSLRAMHRV